MNTQTLDRTTEIRTLQSMLKSEQLGRLTDRQWDEIAEHVEVHRYLVNESISYTITWDDAVFSWYENVFVPVMRAAEAWEVRAAFPNLSRGQRYLAIATHWHYLKRNMPEITPEDAAVDFAATYGEGIARWFSRFLNPVRSSAANG